MFRQKLSQDLKITLEELGYQATDIVCTIPKNSEFGDYTSNIALQQSIQNSQKDKQSLAASATNHSPIEIAHKIAKVMEKLDYLKKVEVAGNGFINFFLKDQSLME